VNCKFKDIICYRKISEWDAIMPGIHDQNGYKPPPLWTHAVSVKNQTVSFLSVGQFVMILFSPNLGVHVGKECNFLDACSFSVTGVKGRVLTPDVCTWPILVPRLTWRSNHRLFSADKSPGRKAITHPHLPWSKMHRALHPRPYTLSDHTASARDNRSVNALLYVSLFYFKFVYGYVWIHQKPRSHKCIALARQSSSSHLLSNNVQSVVRVPQGTCLLSLMHGGQRSFATVNGKQLLSFRWHKFEYSVIVQT
jgi:hypothetical protein